MPLREPSTFVPLRRWSMTAVLAASLARTEAAPVDEPPPTDVPKGPLRESAARVVRRLAQDGKREEDGKAHCGKVSEGVPCFPVSTVKSRPRWATTVRQLLGDLGPAETPSPSRPPTLEELKPFRPGPLATVMTLGSFDPGCVGRSVLKNIKGKNDTYYLYRVRDAGGERIAFYDHRLEPATFQGALELLGRFEGECKALLAYRDEDRKMRETEGPRSGKAWP